MWIPHLKEIGSKESDLVITKYARQRVDIQGNREDMHFELCYDDNIMVGFCFYAVDLGRYKKYPTSKPWIYYGILCVTSISPSRLWK